MSYPDDDPNIEFLSEFDYGSQNYCFDLIRLVRDTRDGKVYIAQDSGCSCPIPFEDHAFPTDYTEVRSYQEIVEVVREFTGYDNDYNPVAIVIPSQFARLAQQVLA